MSANWRQASTLQRFCCALLASAGLVGAGFAPAIGASPSIDQMLVGPTASFPAFTWDPADDGTRKLYQKLVYNDCPGSAFVCDVPIETVPRNRRLEIANISCIIVSYSAPGFLVMTGGEMHTFFTPVPSSPGYKVFNSEIQFSVDERTQLSLTYFSAGNVEEINCALSGDLVKHK
jgi:hypothetical protein